jgi:hypothetical protein
MLYLLCFSAPIYKASEMHDKKDRTADNHGNTARHNPECHPAQARAHKQKKTELVLVSQ